MKAQVAVTSRAHLVQPLLQSALTITKCLPMLRLTTSPSLGWALFLCVRLEYPDSVRLRAIGLAVLCPFLRVHFFLSVQYSPSQKPLLI